MFSTTVKFRKLGLLVVVESIIRIFTKRTVTVDEPSKTKTAVLYRGRVQRE